MANRFDMHIQTLPEAEQKATFKFMSWGFESTLGVKGFQMLINIWLKCFLTPRGSDPISLTYGTDFTKMIGSNLRAQDARDVVILSIESCNTQINTFQKTDTSLTATERLGSAVLTNFVIDNTAPGFTATVEIKNQAGERLVFNLPSHATIP
jgi:hypothetical protein